MTITELYDVLYEALSDMEDANESDQAVLDRIEEARNTLLELVRECLSEATLTIGGKEYTFDIDLDLLEDADPNDEDKVKRLATQIDDWNVVEADAQLLAKAVLYTAEEPHNMTIGFGG